MANGMFNKMLNFIGLEESVLEEDIIDEEYDDEYYSQPDIDYNVKSKTKRVRLSIYTQIPMSKLWSISLFHMMIHRP